MVLLARAVRGVEWIAADEVDGLLRPPRLDLAARQLLFELPRPDARLFRLRTVDDLFVLAGDVDGIGPDRGAPSRLAAALPEPGLVAAVEAVGALRPVAEAPLLDVVASADGRRRYNRFAVEDAVGPVLAGLLGGRYASRGTGGGPPPPGQPDLSVRLLVRGGTATVAVRLGRRPLHRRDYKQDTGTATLHPPLAACLARLAAPPARSGSRPGTGQSLALDPFCGDGTVPVELACGPGNPDVLGLDVDAGRLRNAAANAARARVRVALARADAGRLPLPAGSVDAVVTNPPWNVTVEASGTLAAGLDPAWSSLRRVLAPGGRLGLVTAGPPTGPTTEPIAGTGPVAAAGGDLADVLAGHGLPVGTAQYVRIGGRVARILLSGVDAPAELPAGLAKWRRRAEETGLVVGDRY